MSYFGKECQLHTGSLLKAMIRVTYKLSCPAVTRWNSTGVIGASSDQSAAARLSCCCVSLSIPLSLLMLLSCGLTCIFEPACVDMGITISNFTKLKLSCNGGSLGPLESDIPVMLLDSLLKRSASLKMSMKDYI